MSNLILRLSASEKRGAIEMPWPVTRRCLARQACVGLGLLVTLTAQLEASRAQIVAAKANVLASTEAVTAAQAQLKLADARYAMRMNFPNRHPLKMGAVRLNP